MRIARGGVKVKQTPHSLTHLLIYSLTCSLTYSLTYSLTRSRNHFMITQQACSQRPQLPLNSEYNNLIFIHAGVSAQASAAEILFPGGRRGATRTRRETSRRKRCYHCTHAAVNQCRSLPSCPRSTCSRALTLFSPLQVASKPVQKAPVVPSRSPKTRVSMPYDPTASSGIPMVE